MHTDAIFRTDKPNISPARRYRLLPATIAAWCAYLAVDFLTHAVFFAPWWQATAAYWRPATELFRYIPLGYTSFAIYSAALSLLLMRLYRERTNVVTGLQFGAISGVLYGFACVLGAFSAVRMPVSALWVWPVSFAAASSGAGMAAGWVMTGERSWRRVGVVIGVAILLFVAGVVLQNEFYLVPPAR